MKTISLILAPLVLTSSLGFARNPGTLKHQCQRAIANYFESSERKIESIKMGTISNLSAKEYLVEADVMAQAPYDETIISYHCGVFLKKAISTVWQTQDTLCEASQ